MTFRIVLAALVSVLLASCGVKNDLELPSGALPQKDRADPSKPPQPLGQ